MITLTAYQLAIIAGGFTLLGTLIGAWINHRFALYRDNQNRNRASFDFAALKFRSIIAKELSEFKNRGGIFYADRISHLSTIHAACIEFFPALSKSKHKELADLWQKYNKYEQLRAISMLEKSDDKTEDYLNQFISFTTE